MPVMQITSFFDKELTAIFYSDNKVEWGICFKPTSSREDTGMRVFLAVDLDNMGVLQRIFDFQQRVIATGADVKLVEQGNLHFTIKFLGEVSEQTVTRVRELVADIRTSMIKVTYQGAGAFPNSARPNVIWIGSDQNGGEMLSQLAREVERRLAGLKVGDMKPFLPHLTIARVRSGRNRDRLTEFLHSSRDEVFGEDLLTALKIKKSDLTLKGPIYTDLYTHPLTRNDS
jgi:2'-5' RNA ligase